MDISRNDLYRIILEEYLKEENITEAHPALDLLRKMKGDPDYDPRKDPAAYSYDPTFKGDEDETYPMEKPLRGEMNQGELVLAIGKLVHGKDPEEVSEIFELVFEKLPGVEIGEPEEEGRPTAGFQLENLMELIREVLEEGHYHDMGDEDEMYDVLDDYASDPDPDRLHDDPELAGDLKAKYYEMLETSPDEIPDDILIWMMEIDGFEKMIVLDGEGDLANREEAIAALKNV